MVSPDMISPRCLIGRTPEFLTRLGELGPRLFLIHLFPTRQYLKYGFLEGIETVSYACLASCAQTCGCLSSTDSSPKKGRFTGD